jgi:hypothetical protein
MGQGVDRHTTPQVGSRGLESFFPNSSVSLTKTLAHRSNRYDRTCLPRMVTRNGF